MRYTCTQCGGKQIEICLPAFFEANKVTYPHVSTDIEAEALSYYCRDCEDSVPVEIDCGSYKRTDAGRWYI